jgi:hypothetical protein
VPPHRGGKVVAPATKGGMHFQRPQGGWPVFRRPQGGCQGFIIRWRRRRRTSPAQRYYITPEGGALNPSGRHQPIPDRTLGAQGQRPGGAINPRPRKRASTFGNTASRRQCLKVPQSFAAALAFRQSSTSFLPKSPCSCSNLATTGAVASCQRWISSFGIT